MKILVMGGTGAMGKHLVTKLKGNNHDIYVTTRRNVQSEVGITYLIGSAKDEEFIRPILDDEWDVIVDFMVYNTTEFKSRVDLFLRATKQYVFISSARVYADSKQPITEDSPRLLDVCENNEYLKTDEYALTKARQEDLLFESGQKNWTIVRPYITYSEQRLQLGPLEKEAWLFRVLRKRGLIFNQEMLMKKTTLTYGLDVASAIISLLGKELALGEAFHITCPESMTWHDVLDVYSNVLKNYPEIEYKEQFNSLDEIKQWHNAHHQIDYDRLYTRCFNNKKINQFIDTSKFIEPRIGLENCLLEFLTRPRFNAIDWRSEAIKDKQINCYTSFAEPIGIKNKLKYLIYRYVL